ncbi:MAG TPA: hypothetical protein HPP81_05390 [Deltaproteobacteria bacterium]|jgi:hypothetical protein|nr:hypothetical protein [Deltaproteobacteria bacterium]
MATIEKRIAELETLTEAETGGDKTFTGLVGQARKRAGRGEPVREIRITRKCSMTPQRAIPSTDSRGA